MVERLKWGSIIYIDFDPSTGAERGRQLLLVMTSLPKRHHLPGLFLFLMAVLMVWIIPYMFI